jgi:Fur family ferric uptake transcriptional regulator
MADEKFYTDKLELRGIRPTAMRILILRTMMVHDEAVAMGDIERRLPSLDKSTISRTISLFLLHRLIHCIDDGSGALKYAVCSDDCDCSIDDEHTHFYCESCHRTFCLKQIHVPVVPLPEGFKLCSINYVLKGLCPECSEKAERKGRPIH